MEKGREREMRIAAAARPPLTTHSLVPCTPTPLTTHSLVPCTPTPHTPSPCPLFTHTHHAHPHLTHPHPAPSLPTPTMHIQVQPDRPSRDPCALDLLDPHSTTPHMPSRPAHSLSTPWSYER
eukprot:363646-Chlamydomonas_euryale.AAC.1